MATDISGLRGKVENEGMNEQGRLSANEFDTLVKAVMENQGSVKSVSMNNSTPISPDENGNVNLTIALGDYEQILTLKYNGSVLGGDNNTILSADGNVVVQVQYSESEITQSGQDVSYTPTGTLVTLSVIGIGASGNQTTLLTRNIASVGHGSTVFTDIDLKNYLSDGEQSIQFRITNTINANTKQQNVTIVKANLELRIEDDASWYRDARIMDGSNATITTRHIVLGAVEKTLHVKFIGVNGSRTVDVTGITSNSPTEVTTTTFTETVANNIGFFGTNGVRSVEAWITCDYGELSVESNHITNQVIIVADEETVTPMIALQSKIESMQNYETMTIFSWNMYNPNLASGQYSNAEFSLADQQKTIVWLTQSIDGVENNNIYLFSQNISIESSSTLIDVYIFAKIDNVDVGQDALVYFQVDNSVDYSAVSGADFYLNPSLRYNTENNPNRIINSYDNSVVQGCTFENMAWMDGVDGWMRGNDGRRFLRIASGGKITIPYSVYSQYTSNSRHFLTIEIDFAARNVTNEEDPIITIGNRNFVLPRGVYMKPLNGAFLTNNISDWSNADISWQENTRTHVVFNICHNYTIINPDITRGTDQPTTKTISLIRTYINGIINREYTFDPTDAATINAGGDIVLGQAGYLLLPTQPEDWATNYTNYYRFANDEYVAIDDSSAPTFATNTYYKKIQSGCDLDIYCIRVYKDTNDKANISPTDVIKNYISTLTTGAERQSFKAANDILQGGLISFQKALAAGYNCLVWHGLPVNKSNSNSQKRYGYAEIYRHNADGTLDRAHSGKLYGIEMKGQGTTAMGYAEWNIQFKEDKKTSTGHDEYKYNDNGILRNVFVDEDNVIAFGSSKKGFGYKLYTNDPTGKKLVGKINYASSMQSHKEGACNLYNDLYASIVGSESVTNFGSHERVTVKEEPFLYFVQRTDGNQDSLKVFQGLMTFGPGKADKPTWGVNDDDLKAGDSMLEGSLNNNPLTDMRVPFIDNGDIKYSVKNEAFMYAGIKNLNFSFGDTADLHDGQGAWEHVEQDDDEDSSEVPTTDQVKLWQPIFNFLYLTNVGIKPWTLSLAELNEAAADDDFDYKSAYWMNGSGTGYSRFDLYRCRYTKDGNVESREFVPAGLRLVQGVKTYTNFNCLYATSENDETKPQSYDSTDRWYDTDTNGNRTLTLNIKTALESALGTTINTSGVSADNLNIEFKKGLANLFASYVNSNLYINKKSNLFHHEIMKFWAGTDNRSKNTYYRLNITLTRPNMEMNDDDLDTIFKTNNAGVQSKPYYILEHDEDSLGRTYWDGQDNALNNSLEAAYSSVLGVSGDRQNELQAMMNTILDRTVSLVGSGDVMPDGTTIPSTPLGCMDKYFFRIQKYFPAVAYNETARIRYEVPATFYMSEQPAQAPLTQSLGDQYDSEREYVKRRIIMLAGYAGYELDMLSFRGYLGAYTANVTPHFWLYPMSKMGNPSDSPVKSNVRVPAGTQFALNMGTAVSGNTIFLHFINEMSDIGNIGTWGNGNKDGDASSVISFTSERLRSFKCYGATSEDVTFPLGTVNLSGAPNIEEVNCRNCSTLSSFENGLSSLMRLQSVDIRGTNVKTVQLPQTTSLRTLYLPAGFETLNVRNCPNLTTITIGDYSGLQSIIATNVGFNSKEIIDGCYSSNKDLNENVLQTVALTNIAWTDVTAAMLTWLLTVQNLTLTGSITMKNDATGQIPFALKKALIDKFGDVDSSSNPLRVVYASSSLGGVTVNGDGYFDAVGEEKYYDLIPNSVIGNTIRSYEWSIVSGSSGIDPDEYIEISDPKGWFKCKKMGNESLAPTVTIQCVVTLVDGTQLAAATATIRCYFRQAKLGDFVYHDGTWDDRLNVAKTVIGICFYCKQIYENGQPTGRYDRRMVALSDSTTCQWGLYPNGGSAVNGDGFPSTGANALKYDLNGVPTAPFDVPNLGNITTDGASYTTFANMIDQENPSDEYPIDDPQRYFKVYDNTTAVGRLNLVELSQTLKDAVFAGDNLYDGSTMVPQGLHDTAAIIAHRNNVLYGTTYDPDPNSSGDEVPYINFTPNDTYPSDLDQKILDIRDFAQKPVSEGGLGSSYPKIYSQYLFPAASHAFAYQPTVATGQTLNEKFTANHWYLPSIGELARLCFFSNQCYSGSSLYNESAGTMFGDIFAAAVSANKYTRYSLSSLYWSSSECSQNTAWLVAFSFVHVYTDYIYSSYLVVRPVAAF